MRTATFLVFTATLVSTFPAFAQRGAETATAQALFDEGQRLFAEGKFVEACPKFEESLRLVDGLGTRGRLAQCYEKEGRTASAWAMWSEVDAMAGKAGEARRQRYAAERAKELSRRLAYLTVNVAATEADVTVVRNGVEVGSAAFGTPIAVDPGTQSITAKADGYKDWTTTVEVPVQGKETVEVPELEKLPPPPDPVTTTPGGSPNMQPNPTLTQSGPPPWKKPVGIGMVGGGVAVLAVGFVFGGLAKSKHDEAYALVNGVPPCDSNNVCTPAGQALVDDARSRATLSTVFVISGAAIAAAGAAVWLIPFGESGNEVAVAPAVGDEQVGLSVSGRF